MHQESSFSQLLTKPAISSLKTYLSRYELPNIYFIHGFLTAVVSDPEFIKPGEWINALGLTQVDNASLEEVNDIFGTLLAMYNDIIHRLAQGRFHIFPSYLKKGMKDKEEAKCYWARGYIAAVDWDEESWLVSDEVPTLLFPMLLSASDELLAEFIENADAEGITLTSDELRQCDERLLSEIANVVYQYWRESESRGFELAKRAASQAKIGRNEPCPCGSGKKYKRCCLPVYH